jgi:pre-mRNA-splicing factor ATP-dependent RNA helicase DHX38/PRP16
MSDLDRKRLRDDELDGPEAGSRIERRQAEKDVDLHVHPQIDPPFLSGATGSKTASFLRDDQKIILPVKSPELEFVRLAQAGSATLADLRKKQIEARSAKDLIDSSTGVAKLLGRGVITSAKISFAATPEQREDHVGLLSDEKHRAILQQRRALPIFRSRQELLRCIGENRVTVVKGETGSGKTTQLVQYLFEHGYAEGDMLIGCTQPRRLAAMSVARRVSDEMRCELGSTVGYAIHLDDKTSSSTRVKFMTDGVLLREVVGDRDITKYSVIVMDEAHERSVDTDVLLGVLKNVVRRRSDFRLIVTSATMDITRFSQFFDNAPIFEIEGRAFDVSIQYSEMSVTDYVSESVFRACQIHVCESPGDILIFMTGKEDVEGTCELIRERLGTALSRDGKNALQSLLIVPCYSELMASPSQEALVRLPPPPGMRKCVVATNVAETSITIDGVRFVIDCGFMKTNVLHLGMQTLKVYPISTAQAIQRKGRAGRTQAGVCYRLYTKHQFENELLPSAIPEIQRTSIDSVVLTLKSIGVDDVTKFDFLDTPPAINVRSALRRLWLIDALDDVGCITKTGRQIIEFPMEPILSNLIVRSAAFGCSDEMLSIVSMIASNSRNIFELPKGKEDIAAQRHGRFLDVDSDHLTLLNVLRQFVSNSKTRAWAAGSFLNYAVLQRACDVRDHLLERMARAKLPVTKSDDLDVVRRCLGECLFQQSARRSGAKWTEYRSLVFAGVTTILHPSSALNSRGKTPEYVVFNEIVATEKEYMTVVTAVEGRWLSASSKGLFTVAGAALAQESAQAAPAGSLDSFPSRGTSLKSILHLPLDRAQQLLRAKKKTSF